MSKALNIYMPPASRKQLQYVAGFLGTSESATIRLLVSLAYAGEQARLDSMKEATE